MGKALQINDLPIWLINLKSSPERYASMQVQLDALDLQHQRVEAVNGKAAWAELATTVDIPGFQRNVGREVMPGEVGCYHSHLKVWKALASSGADIGLVLEDDVVFGPDFCRAVNAALGDTEKWDILKLNHIRAKFPIRLGRVDKWMFCHCIGPLTGTGAYLIKADVADGLTKCFLPISRPIDHQIDLLHRENIRHLALMPFPSRVEDHGQSTITGQQFAGVRKFPPYKRLYTYLQRWKNLITKGLFAFQLKRSGR